MSAYRVLWGTHPLYAGGVPIRITGGSPSFCAAESRYRARLGWSGLVVLSKGERP